MKQLFKQVIGVGAAAMVFGGWHNVAAQPLIGTLLLLGAMLVIGAAYFAERMRGKVLWGNIMRDAFSLAGPAVLLIWWEPKMWPTVVATVMVGGFLGSVVAMIVVGMMGWPLPEGKVSKLFTGEE